MQKRWAIGFTVVELIIVIVVIGILTVVSVVGYNGVRKGAAVRVVQSDLENITAEMQRTYQKTGSYPNAVPVNAYVSPDISLSVKEAGSLPFYTGLSAVQNGVLLAQICADLISEGVGKGTNQGGVVEDYITGCGNWNHDNMQITGWNTKKWDTPISEASFTTYGNNFTTNDTWNKIQETVVENFYNGLVNRLKQEGGSFPVTTFWDTWATQNNGGVMLVPLDANPTQNPFYCIEAISTKYPDVIWHVTEDTKLTSGAC